MLPVFTAEEMRRLDRRAVQELGIPGATLMENAGRGAAAALLAALPSFGAPRRGARVVLLCGKGGNGGDGFVVARLLRRAGHRPEVFLAAPTGEIAGDAALKLRAMTRAGVGAQVVEDDAALVPALAAAHVVVDALLGTGARGAPTGLVARLIERVNGCGRPVVALDVPSGLPADGGPPAGPAVRAALTPTFGGLKRGLVTGPGLEHAGRVTVVDIGIPPEEARRDVATFLVERGDVVAHVPRRRRDTHKGSYGHLLVLAGSVGKTGAAALTARAAMRAGAGLVTVATAARVQPVVAGLLLEAMSEPLPDTPAGTVAAAARKRLDELSATRDAVAMGPGLGLVDETRALARDLVATLPRPIAVDADALTALAGSPETLASAPAPRCLTPHPGEMARLLGVSAAEVQRDRIETARGLAAAWGVHVALKGAGTVIAAPGGRVLVNPTGNAGMASGGTGDVLTGIVGAFLARGLDAEPALVAAVYVHGLAGDVAAERVGEESLVAGDVVDALPEAFRRLRADD